MNGACTTVGCHVDAGIEQVFDLYFGHHVVWDLSIGAVNSAYFTEGLACTSLECDSFWHVPSELTRELAIVGLSLSCEDGQFGP